MAKKNKELKIFKGISRERYKDVPMYEKVIPNKKNPYKRKKFRINDINDDLE